jgi:hypothetical protein
MRTLTGTMFQPDLEAMPSAHGANPPPTMSSQGRGSVRTDYYLDEFTFRYNRRDSRARGLLF